MQSQTYYYMSTAMYTELCESGQGNIWEIPVQLQQSQETSSVKAASNASWEAAQKEKCKSSLFVNASLSG